MNPLHDHIQAITRRHFFASTGFGLGGAAFPTHVKLKLPPGKSVDTLILNGAECEPYLTTDHRVMLEQTSTAPPTYRVGLLFSFKGVKRVEVSEERLRPT